MTAGLGGTYIASHQAQAQNCTSPTICPIILDACDPTTGNQVGAAAGPMPGGLAQGGGGGCAVIAETVIATDHDTGAAASCQTELGHGCATPPIITAGPCINVVAQLFAVSGTINDEAFWCP